MSRSEFHPDDSSPDPTRILEQHLLAGFSPDLALDLVLNELVVRAAQATRASAAALALVRGDEMVCRAATGHLAPDLGVALNTRDGLSGACLQTRQPQLSVDTEFDPRVDPAISHRRGIRSILIVPVFDSNDKNARFTGVLEVFSTSPAAFSHNHQKVLEAFAEECARIRQAAIELSRRKAAAAVASPEVVPPALIPSDFVPPEFTPPGFIAPSPPPASRSPYEAWTLLLGSLAILATIAVSFLIGSRIGWLHSSRTASSSQFSQPIPAGTNAPAKSCVGTAAPGCPAEQSSAGTTAAHQANPPSSERASEKTSGKSSRPMSNVPPTDELIVYEKGKVIFRMQPAPSKPDSAKHHQAKPDDLTQDSDAIVEASSTTRIAPTNLAPTKIAPAKIAPAQTVWLAPAQSEARLLTRTEPLYPPEALAAHRAGTVVLEVQVAEDGSVSNVRTLSGDPVLAAAAAEAVRNWRYQPYRQLDHPAQFQTDVTLTFTLPN